MTDSLNFDAELRAALGNAYTLERELTGSGMSRVFLATERALDRKVVVKVLPPELAAGVNRDRFRREIQLAAQLQHPHIVPLLAAGAKGDLLFFTMPYIEGESLRHALQNGVRFSLREVVRTLHDVSDALAHAHARGVIHRDIKPGNVLRSGSHALVTDFGVAKAISAAMPVAGVTTSGMAIGTPAYMAPEQLAGDPAADHRVDIYALGLLAYELLTGDAPFKAPSPQETMAAQLTRAPAPITKYRSDVPPALSSLVTRCLAKNPNDRPQTASEVTGILDELEMSSGAAPSSHGAGNRRGLVVSGVAVLTLLAIAFAVRGRWLRVPDVTTVTTRTRADSVTGATAKSVLTRADSLAIARAVEKKMAEQQGVVRARAESTQQAHTKLEPDKKASVPIVTMAQQMEKIADSLRREIEHAVLDSVARQRGLLVLPGGAGVTTSGESFRFEGGLPVRSPTSRIRPGADSVGRFGRDGRPTGPQTEFFRGPGRASPLSREQFAERLANMGPPRRLFVSYPAPNRRRADYSPATDSLVDSLRRAIGRVERFLLVDADTVRNTLVRTRSYTDIAQALNVDLFASLYLNVMPDSSVMWQVTIRDLSAHPSFGTRSVAIHVPHDTLLQRADSLVGQTLKLLHELDRAPRKPPPTEPQSPTPASERSDDGEYLARERFSR